MKAFLKSKTFIALCIIGVLLLGMILLSVSNRGRVTFFEDILGAVIIPIQKTCTTMIGAAGDFAKVFSEYDILKEENEKLKKELTSIEQALRNAEKLEAQAEEMRGMLKIAEKNRDFEFEQALVVASEQTGYSSMLTLNKGAADGLKKRDLVIVSEGVVGYISEVGTTWSKVTTILDSSCEIGALVTRTQDVGIIEGDFILATNGLCKLSYLKNDVVLNVGDNVETSGISGIFPGGIAIGRIKDLKPETHGTQYGIIEPAVNPTTVKHVFVIIKFAGEQND